MDSKPMMECPSRDSIIGWSAERVLGVLVFGVSDERPGWKAADVNLSSGKGIEDVSGFVVDRFGGLVF